MIVLRFIIGIILIVLAVMMWNGSLSIGCERMANEYSATVDMSQRDALFNDGMSAGCFHHE